MKIILQFVLLCFTSLVLADNNQLATLLGNSGAQVNSDELCSVRVQVTFVVPWTADSFFVTRPDDPDGPAVFMSNRSKREGLSILKEIKVGDILDVLGRPLAFLLEPGLDIIEATRVDHQPLDSPHERAISEIQSGQINNRRVSVRGIVTEAQYEQYGPEKMSFLTLVSDEGSVRVRARGRLSQIESYRDAEVRVEGVVVPNFNPRAEFIDAEIELFSLRSISILRAAPADYFDVPECDTVGLLSWHPVGHTLHARRVTGEVTYVDEARETFVIQRGLSAMQVFAPLPFPKVGECVDVAGFAERREAYGVLANARWRKSSARPPAIQPYDFSELDECVTDVERLMSDNDLQLRLVKVCGRVVSCEARENQSSRLILDVEGKSQPVIVESPFIPDCFSVCEDSPILQISGVLDAHVTNRRALEQLFSFNGFTVLPRVATDFQLIPDASYRFRRALRITTRLLLFSLIPIFIIAIVFLVRRHSEQVKARSLAADRRRIANELHDSISQHISGAKMWLFAAKTAGGAALSDEATHALRMANDVLEETRVEIRQAILNLQSDEFLNETLRDVLMRFARVSNVPGRVHVRASLSGLPPDMPMGEKRDVLAIVQESFSNAVRHGGATRVVLQSEGNGRAFTLTMVTNGQPFDPEAMAGEQDGHFGLSNMRARAQRAHVTMTFGTHRQNQMIELKREGKIK